MTYAIKKTNNPFQSTRSNAISSGVFIRMAADYQLGTEANNAVNIGLKKELSTEQQNIIATNNPRHLMILANFGEGKSFSLKCIQDALYCEYYYPFIGIILGNDTSFYNEDTDDGAPLLIQIVKYLKDAYESLPLDIYPTKDEIKIKYLLDHDNSVERILENYDKAFKELECVVFIFIDELDKIFIDKIITDPYKIKFLNNLKTLTDIFTQSISLWCAGTNNVEAYISSRQEDYMQRFHPISSIFNYEDTLAYVRTKCRKEVNGPLPFAQTVIKIIHKVTSGNLRLLNSCCYDLWGIAAEQKHNITLNDFFEYLKTKLRVHILSSYPNISDILIDAISRTIVYDKLSIQQINKLYHSKSANIKNFFSDQDQQKKFIKQAKSYKMSDNLRISFLRKVVGQ